MSGRIKKHVHIKLEEMEDLYEIDLREASTDELQRLMEIDEKANRCPVCRKRYDFFMDSAKIFGFLLG